MNYKSTEVRLITSARVRVLARSSARVCIFLAPMTHSVLPPYGTISSKTKELESIIGRLTHLSLILPAVHHFISRIRELHTRAAQNNQTLTKVSDPCVADLELMLLFINKANKGINMNIIAFRKPTHVYQSDLCPAGLGGFSHEGFAWRFYLPEHLRFRASWVEWMTPRPSSERGSRHIFPLEDPIAPKASAEYSHSRTKLYSSTWVRIFILELKSAPAPLYLSLSLSTSRVTKCNRMRPKISRARPPYFPPYLPPYFYLSPQNMAKKNTEAKNMAETPPPPVPRGRRFSAIFASILFHLHIFLHIFFAPAFTPSALCCWATSSRRVSSLLHFVIKHRRASSIARERERPSTDSTINKKHNREGEWGMGGERE